MKISDSEMKLMKILWAHAGEMTLVDLTEKLGDIWKTTTVSTFLKRLSDKGAVNVRRAGKTCYYSAAVTEDEYKQEQTKEFIKEIHNGSVDSLLAALCGGAHPDKEKLDSLKKWFEEL